MEEASGSAESARESHISSLEQLLSEKDKCIQGLMEITVPPSIAEVGDTLCRGPGAYYMLHYCWANSPFTRG